MKLKIEKVRRNSIIMNKDVQERKEYITGNYSRSAGAIVHPWVDTRTRHTLHRVDRSSWRTAGGRPPRPTTLALRWTPLSVVAYLPPPPPLGVIRCNPQAVRASPVMSILF